MSDSFFKIDEKLFLKNLLLEFNKLFLFLLENKRQFFVFNILCLFLKFEVKV